MEPSDACRLHRTDRASRGDQGGRPPAAQAGPRPGARQGRRHGPEPDRPVCAVGVDSDAAVVPLHHRLRPGGDRRGGQPGSVAVQARRSRLGLEPGPVRPAGGRRPSTQQSTRTGSTPPPPGSPTPRPRRMALVGITAHIGLFQYGRLQRGETVYVPGGSGGVGSMVVQMAKAAGARVATSAGSDAKLSSARNWAPTSPSTTRPTISPPAPRIRPGGCRRLVRDPARAQPRGLHPPAPQAAAGCS